MGIIFVISPVYLEALYEEAKPFDFRLQGYGNFTDACEGLLYTNVKDIIGYAYVADNLPKDLKEFDRFLSYCNLIATEETTFMLAIKDERNLADLKGFAKYKKINFSHIPNIEVFTDLLIKRDIYGSLLLSKYEPYQLNVEPQKHFLHDISTIEYKPLFNNVILSLFNKPYLMRNVEETLKNDEIYNDVSKYSAPLEIMRRMLVMLYFGKSIIPQLEEARQLILKVEDPIEFCNYSALLKLLEGKNAQIRNSNKNT